jgi:hypothetical protein
VVKAATPACARAAVLSGRTWWADCRYRGGALPAPAPNELRGWLYLLGSVVGGRTSAGLNPPASPSGHMKVLALQVQPDHVQRIARSRKPTLALAELVWNALDADARHVNVYFDRDLVGGIEAIHVEDNGTGISEVDAEAGFSNIGGSWKQFSHSTRDERRVLHGKEGKGRLHAFALGSHVTWTSRSKSSLGKVSQLAIETSFETVKSPTVSDVLPLEASAETGTEVVVREVEESAHTLLSSEAMDELAEIFAFYLRQYPMVEIRVNGSKLDPVSQELYREEYQLPPFDADGEIVTDAKLSVVEWRSKTTRSLYVCDPAGFTLQAASVGIQAPGFQFTAHLRTAYARKLYDRNELMLGNEHPGVQALHDAARTQLRDHFRRRSAERATELVEEWKRDKIYPYEGEPATSLERSERQVFDIVALNVSTHLPDFAASDRRNKQFSLRLLRQGIESNPESMQRILTDVLGLPKQKQDELAELLERTSLSSIIAASKVVADRLSFLRAIEVLIYERASKQELLERQQLHRIIADHTWLFGEEYNLSVDDESLTEVLRKHLHLIGRTDLPTGKKMKRVKRANDTDGIVDLMVSRAIPQTKHDEREHLIVELKRPKQKVDQDVIAQTVNYALAVARDERFRSTKTRWVFWAVSNELDEFAEFQARQSGRARGIVVLHDEPRITVWARSWAEIIEDCRARLTFFQKALDYTADRETALAMLRRTHEKYFPQSLLDSTPAA